MLEIQRNDEERILIMRMSGQIDSAEMNAGLERFIEAAQSMSNGRILAFATDVELPTLAALGVELRHLPKLFGLLDRFERTAVVANQDWVQGWSRVEGVIFPGLNIKVFDADQEAKARAYLSDSQPAS